MATYEEKKTRQLKYRAMTDDEKRAHVKKLRRMFKTADVKLQLRECTVIGFVKPREQAIQKRVDAQLIKDISKQWQKTIRS